MNLQPSSIAMVFPDMVKEASLLYEYVAVLTVNAPLGFPMNEDEKREFAEWHIQGAEIVPDEKHWWVDYSHPAFLSIAGRLLKLSITFSPAYKDQYIVSLISGSSDLTADLAAISELQSVSVKDRDSKQRYAHIVVEGVSKVLPDAPWEQIREFRKDESAKKGYRGIVHLHRLLEKAQSNQQAHDLLSSAIKAHNDAISKHGFPVEKSRIALLGATGALAAQLFGGTVGGATISALTAATLAAYSLFEQVQQRRLAEAPALLVKVQGLADRIGEKTARGKN